MDNGPFGAGNRGLEYGTSGGEHVRAAAWGTVTFAGPVGGRLAVTIRHVDGTLSSITNLLTVLVAAGDKVLGGETIGTADRSLHFGVRRDGRYIDPALLLEGFRRARSAYLVPVGATERGALGR